MPNNFRSAGRELKMNKARRRDLAEILHRTGEALFPHIDNPAIDVYTKNSDGDTALHIVALWGDVEALEALLDAGARIDEPGDMGCTPLYNAVAEGHEEAVETLLSRGANPDAINELGTTPRLRAMRSLSEKLQNLFR